MKNPSSNQVSHQQGFHIILLIYSLLVSVSAFITALIIFFIPSDPGNSFLFGLSLQRLILIGIAVFPGMLSAIFGVWVYRDEVWGTGIWLKYIGNEKFLSHIIQVTTPGFLAGWIVSFTPIYLFADYKDYYFRLSPLIHWSTIVCGITLAMALTEKYGLHWSFLSNTLRAQKKSLILAFILLMIFIFIWIFIAWTGLGIRVVEDYWYGAGVPILGIQVLIAFAVGMGVLLFERSLFGARFFIRSDFLVFIVIWIIAAFFWVREPLPGSFFATGPYPPAFEYFPYSDASTFDLGGQFALIGQGLNNGASFDRILYMGFLVFLHAFAGQNYLHVIAWQTAVYAVFPGILYLLGKALHSRTFGVILAALAILRGINGIAASNMIDLANQKQMLTDFPMAIFVAGFTLMVVNWLKAPGENYLYILWIGGVMGLAVMLRTHAIFLIAFGLLLILVVFNHQKLRGALVSFLLVLGVLASVLPWGVQNGGAIFEVYKSKFQARYQPFLFPVTPTPSQQGNALPVFSIKNRGLDLIATLPSRSLSLTTSHLLFFSKSSTNDVIEVQNRNYAVQSLPLSTSILTNFLHNLVTSVLILPTSPVFHDLRHTIKEVVPFWSQYWDGELGIGAGFFLLLNLLTISLGMGISWKSAGNSGLVPLGVFLFYNLANAAARTSGGRYIVPADWVVFLYFSLGLLQIIYWGMSLFGLKDDFDAKNSSYDQAGHMPWTWEPLKRTPWVLITFLVVGGLLPLSNHLFPLRYSAQSQSELLTVLDQKGYLKEMGFDKAALNSTSEQWPAFTILNGRALYPRFFLENKGLPKKLYPYKVLGYPRLGFTLIGPNGVNAVVLPEDRMPYFPNGSDVIVFGCKNNDGVDALGVVVMDEQVAVYVRQPASTLQCPLQIPVCNANHICR